MRRDIGQLTSRTFDVLVVGGGIYGLTVAYDAAQRGLSVALIEREDFGSGASFNHLRTIHGGLRYLQTLDIARARESIRERRTLARIAPQFLLAVPFVLPLDSSLTKGRAVMRAGFALDRVVAFDRNRGVASRLRVPGGRVVSRRDALERFRELRGHNLAGAAIWYDYVATEADRLTFSYALAAAAHGAVVANYVEASMMLREKGRVTGVRAVDRQTGRDFDIGARLTVNASGACVERLADPAARSTPLLLLKAMNLVTRRPASDEAFGGRTASGRSLFAVPWRGRTLFGTSEATNACDPDASAVSEAEVQQFIDELNRAFPGLDLTMPEVTLVHRGLVPAAAAPGGRVTLEGHERIHDANDGTISLAGAKYTTARAVAERIVDRAMTILQRGPVTCRTADTPLIAGIEDPTGVSDDVRHVTAAYGARARDVFDLARERPDLRAPVAPDSPVIGAQLVWAVREEMAVTLRDAVLRRTPLGALGFPGDDAVARAAGIVGNELAWSDDRRRDEISSLRRFYAPVAP